MATSLVSEVARSHAETRATGRSESTGVISAHISEMRAPGRSVQARTRTESLPADVMERIPVDASHSEQALVMRRSIERIEMPIFSKVTNREDVIFEGAEPLLQIDAD